ALPVDGTAVAATQLETARTLSVSGAASGSVSFDGTANADIAITLADSGVAAGSYSTVSVNAQGLVTGGDQLTGDDLGLGTA
ncbi:phage tail protein, partial [Pseudomonas sp. SIMBA_041]